MKNNAMSLAIDNQPDGVSMPLDLSQGNISKEVNSLPARQNAGNTVKMQQGHAKISHFGTNSVRSGSRYQDEDPEHHNAVVKNYKSFAKTKESERQHQNEAAASQLVSKEKDLGGSKAQRPISGGRGKRYVFTAKNPGSKSSYQAADASRTDSSGFQRRPRRKLFSALSFEFGKVLIRGNLLVWSHLTTLGWMISQTPMEGVQKFQQEVRLERWLCQISNCNRH